MEITQKENLAVEYVVHHGMKSHHAAKIAGVPENRIAELTTDYLLFMDGEEQYYESVVRSQTEQAVRELVNDFPERFRHEMTRKRLLSELRDARADSLPTEKLVKQIKIFTGLIEGITPESILRAREYPIGTLIKVVQNKAKCLWHSEKTASLHVYKTNTVHCFGCDKSGDAIDVYMGLKNCSFKEAVLALS